MKINKVPIFAKQDKLHLLYYLLKKIATLLTKDVYF